MDYGGQDTAAELKKGNIIIFNFGKSMCLHHVEEN